MRLRDCHAYLSVMTQVPIIMRVVIQVQHKLSPCRKSGSELITNGCRHFGCKSMLESSACCRLKSEKHHHQKSYSLLSLCLKTLSNKYVFCRKLAVMLHVLLSDAQVARNSHPLFTARFEKLDISFPKPRGPWRFQKFLVPVILQTKAPDPPHHHHKPHQTRGKLAGVLWGLGPAELRRLGLPGLRSL